MKLDIEWGIDEQIADKMIWFYIEDYRVKNKLKELIPNFDKMFWLYWDVDVVLTKVGNRTKKKLLWYIIELYQTKTEELPI
jgi:hypothetical protein